MQNVIRFTATKLANTNKEGILKPDPDGYYELCIGALNSFNSAGEYYTLKGAEELFSSSSSFMRRIANGCLKSEVDHPRPEPGMTDKQYLERVLSIEQKNVCAHIKEIWLKPTSTSNGMVLIMGKVKPAGVKGPALKDALDNKHENVCFSIRALTSDYMQGSTRYRVLKYIQTFDWVTEPGISTANKWDAPALESLSDKIILLNDLKSIAHAKPMNGLSMEEANVSAIDALQSIQRSLNTNPVPFYSQW